MSRLVEKSREKPRRIGRHAVRRKTVGGTQPGQAMLLALLSAVPVLVIFVFGALARPGTLPWDEYRVMWPLFLVGTPVLAAAAIARFYTAEASARDHPAARFGRALGFGNAVIWLLYAGLYFFLKPA